MSSETSVPLPIAGCLLAADKFFGVDKLDWRTRNNQQAEFITKLYPELANLIPSIGDMMESRASTNVAEINEWLISKGFDIQLDPDISDLALASILTIIVKWAKEGKKTTLKSAGKEYPAAEINKEGVRFFGLNNCPVVQLSTQSGAKVNMAMVETYNECDYYKLACEITRDMMSRDFGYDSLIFPFIDLNDKPDISWLVGMETSTYGSSWIIGQALQQTKLKMNHIGARAESAVAIGMYRCAIEQPRPPFVIDKPFLVWFTTKENQVLFVAYCDRDCWKDPGEINFNK